MENSDLLAALQRDGDAFADACETAGLGASVAACPGWSVADLAWHLVEVHYFWHTMVAEQRSTWEGYEPPDRPRDAQLLDLYRDGLRKVIDVLSAVDPAQSTWTWTTDQTAGWVIRRMAQETAIHAWDAASAAGRDGDIEPKLASDGIDEFLTWFLPDTAEDAAPVGGSVHIHCGDVSGEWTLHPNDSGFDVTREHAKGDCAIRGSAGDILLALWRRRPLSSVDVVGNADVAARFIAHTALR
jgi:uncharacterized protein (TIGR03083 family)